MNDEEVLVDFVLSADTSIAGVILTGDIGNMCINLKCEDFEDTLKASCTDKVITLVSEYSGEIGNFTSKDYMIDNYVENILCSRHTFDFSNSSMVFDLSADEDDEVRGSNDKSASFSKLNIELITSDLSVVVLSKLVYNNELMGYRFRLNNGCLDISIDKGRELGIVPYKVCKRVQLTVTNGVYASKYECTHRVLFPDISNDDELCRRLLEIVLS